MVEVFFSLYIFCGKKMPAQLDSMLCSLTLMKPAEGLGWLKHRNRFREGTIFLGIW